MVLPNSPIRLLLASVLLSLPLPAISVAITSTQNTGFNSSGSLITSNGGIDPEWTFYNASGVSYQARTVRTSPSVLTGAAPNTSSSQWIAPSAFYTTESWRQTSSTSSSTRYRNLWSTYTVASTFTVPAYSGGTDFWLLVLGATVYGDDNVTGYGLRSGSS